MGFKGGTVDAEGEQGACGMCEKSDIGLVVLDGGSRLRAVGGGGAVRR